MTDNLHLFAIVLEYIADKEAVDAARQAHLDFIKQYQDQGTFLLSGPQSPRKGGFILAKGPDKAFFESIMSNDPFITQQIAIAQVIEIEVTHCLGSIKEAIDKAS